MRRRNGPAAGVAGLAVVMTLTACGGSGEVAKPTYGDTTPAAAGSLDKVTWLLSSEPGTLDMDVSSGQQADTVVTNVCERLMQLQPDLTTKPSLARTVTRPDDRTIVFDLRDDVRFHDGATMTADDVVYSLNRHRAKDSVKADEFANVSSIAKTGPLQVTLRLTQPDAIIVPALAGDAGIVYHAELAKQLGKTLGSPGARDACSGPYTIADWRPGDHLTLRAAPEYWGPKALTTEFVFRWADESAVTTLIAGQEAQGAYLSSPGAVATFRGQSDVRATQGPSTDSWSFQLMPHGPLKDVRVRQALSLAMPRQGIVDAAFGGLATPWKTPIGPGAWGYERETFQRAYDELGGAPSTPSADDLDRARQLIRAAGASGQLLTVAADGTSVENVMSNAFVQAASSIGLRARIITLPVQSYYDYYDSADAKKLADVYMDVYFISKNDPLGFYKAGRTDASLNFLGLSDPVYDKLFTRALGTTDDAARAALTVQVEQRWMQQMPWISVAQPPTTMVMRDSITGAISSAAYLYFPWAARVGRTGS